MKDQALCRKFLLKGVVLKRNADRVRGSTERSSGGEKFLLLKLELHACSAFRLGRFESAQVPEKCRLAT